MSGRTRRLATATAALAGSFLLAAACAGAGAAGPSEITVLAASSLTEAFTELAAGFESVNPDARVRVSFAGSQILAAQLLEGAPGDVFASADTRQMARAAEAGLVGRPRALASNRLVIITPPSDPGNVGAAVDLARDGVAVVLAGRAVPAGRYARQALAALGLEEGVERRVVSEEDDVKGVVAKVALGEADAGIVYATDVRGVMRDRLRTVRLGADVAVRYQIAATTASQQPEIAAQFVEFALDDGAEILRRAGLEGP
ncbi:MAG TPA: molybdate ABC transporter substrate-binding protein [Egibacteraceae bacterium]|nr:molybdate ABC transporter substrate-binding protein [Egibacteraceae bacterium]